MAGSPNIPLGELLIGLLTRRRETRRAAIDQLRLCETVFAELDCTTGHTPRAALNLARTLGPHAAQEVLVHSKPAALAVQIARERLGTCRNLPGYDPHGMHRTHTHRRVLDKYSECLRLLMLAQSRLSSLCSELGKIRMLIEGLPRRIETYNTQIEQLRRTLTAQFWNGTGSQRALGACDSATSLLAAAQLSWEQNEPFMVHRLLEMLEEPLRIMEHCAAANRES